MKICPKCEIKKDKSKFGKNKNRKDGLQTYCKTCRKIIDAESYKNNPNRKISIYNAKQVRKKKIKKIILDAKSSGCAKCSETEVCTLDFHHIRDKSFTISTEVYNVSEQALLDEISKCIVVCSNCHRKIHHGIINE